MFMDQIKRAYKIVATEEANKDFIIKKGSKFWTGSSWHEEYPEAKQFKKLSDAEKEKKSKLNNQGDIVQFYGYDSEHVVG